MSNGENTAEDRKLPPRHPRMYLIRRMLFHANETYKNTSAFVLFRVRSEIGGPAAFVQGLQILSRTSLRAT